MNSNPRFQWNAGGWFGPQLGGTTWILIAAVLVFPKDTYVALATLGFFLAANAIGTSIWIRRSRFRPYPALQVLIVVIGLAGLGATAVLDGSGHFASLGVGAPISARSMYGILAVMVPALLLLFYLIERGNRAATTGRHERPSTEAPQPSDD